MKLINTITLLDELREIDRIAFLQNWQKQEKEILLFYAITFEPIKIQKRSAPQNDRLIITFVKKWLERVLNGDL
jgi:hypothetical protein